MAIRHPAAYLLIIVALTASYFVAGKLGLSLAFFNSSASAVWAPTGIAIAAVLLLGPRVWPAILAGAFLVNVTTAGSVATSSEIAIGNTLEALLAASLVRRFAGGAYVFHHPARIFRFVVLAGLISTTVSPTIGVLSLWSGGYAERADVPLTWLTWWLGDLVGALVFTPLILLWVVPEGSGFPRRSWLEVSGLAGATTFIGWVVFGHHAPNAYAFLIPLLWAALRFGRRVTVTTAFALSAIALWGSLHGYGPFQRPTPNESLLFLQAFVGVMTLSALVLAAVVREREWSEVELRQAHRDLEDRIRERTASLRQAIGDLEKSRSVLSDAQRLARMGSWEWDAGEDRMIWSDEMYRIHGLEPGSGRIDYAGFLARIHPEDRERVAGTLREALESGEAFDFEHRILRSDGAVRTIQSRGRAIRPGGETIGMLGTGQDVTEEREAELVLRENALVHELQHRVAAAANLAGSAEEALGAALAEICRFKGWPLGHVYLPAEDGSGELVPTSIWYPVQPAGHEEFRKVTEATRFRPGIPLPGRVLSSGEPVWIPDVTRPQDFERAGPMADLGLGAAFGFPARVGDEIVAVLEFFTTAVLPPDPNFLQGLGEIGDQLGQVIRRQAAESRLRRSEGQLAEAQAVAHLGSWEWDVVADRIMWSREMFRVYGVEWDPGSDQSVAEVSFDTYLGRIHPDDRPRIRERIQRALEVGSLTDAEYRVVLPDGSQRQVVGRGIVERDSEGRVTRMHGTVQDVTELRRSEEALRQSEENYRMLAEHSSDLTARHTTAGVCTYASPAAERLLGLQPSELVGRHTAELIHPEDLDRVARAHRELFESNEVGPVVCRLMRRSGEPVWVETTARAVRGPEGRVTSIVTVSRDVTESLRIAEEIRLMQRVATVANEASTMREAMQSSLRLVCESMGWPAGHVYVPVSDGLGGLAPTDVWHLAADVGLDALRQLTSTTRFQAGEGLPGRVLESGRAVWIEDVRADPNFPRAHRGIDIGIRSAMAFPVVGGERTLAVLEFFSPWVGPPEERVVDLMGNIGTQLGQVILRQRAQSEVQASELRFRALAESAHDGIVIADERGRIVFCNDGLERIFGYARGELVGDSVETLMPSEMRPEHSAGLSRFIRTGETHIMGRTVELPGRRKDGSRVPVELSLGSWKTDEGTFFAGVLRDITERKQTERALNENVEELARSNAELALFNYVASHDLREPLRTVASNVQIVQRRLAGALDETSAKAMGFAVDGVHRMQGLIDALLAYSRIGTEARPLERVAAGDVVAQAVDTLAVAIEEAKAEITWDELPTVTADEIQLGQVFQNLFANALKYRGEDPPRIHVSAERGDGETVFSVKDNGIGVAAEHAELVFAIFERLGPKQTEVPGTGIGLALCRRIVERHGGRIWVEPGHGPGSVFRFTLPIREEA